MTPVSDIPETVRFSSTSLNTLTSEAQGVFPQEQSFGHNILYSHSSSSHQIYQPPSSNLQVVSRGQFLEVFNSLFIVQVQQWNNLDLELPLHDDQTKMSSISETDSCEIKSEVRNGEAEMFEDEDGEEDEEDTLTGGIVRWGSDTSVDSVKMTSFA